MKHIILSTCGTSILTNSADNDIRSLVNYNANARREALDEATQKKLESYIAQRREAILATTNLDEAKKQSAELNGIISYYKGQLSGRSQDMHYLIVSDTFLGQQVGEIIQSWLEQQGLSVQIEKFSGLVTNNLPNFRSAMTNLIKWCQETLPGYRMSQYHIVFNLTGGFKSAQGFMQTIGMFYADESIYIFETGDNLLRIPKLPIQLDINLTIKQNNKTFRLLGMGQALPAGDVHGIPETLLFEDNGEVILSEWGELVWQQGKRQLYESNLLEPLPGLSYSETFMKNLEKQNLTDTCLATLNERLDQLSLVVQRQGTNPSSLDFKALKGNPKPPSTHECDIWSGDERRLFGHYENGQFVIDDIARGLH
jgi:putative CRISPR-associated protein (TIGR02619 family)